MEPLATDCPGTAGEAGKAAACAGCPGKAVCAAEAPPVAVDPAMALRMGAIRHKVLVLSGKGGVGKSSVACGLASQLALQGARVGLLDLDLCGPSVAHMMGVGDGEVVQTPYGWQPLRPRGYSERLAVMSIAMLLRSRDAPVIWRGPRKDAMIVSMLRDTFWSKLDFLIVDTPPGTSDEHLSVLSALRQVDGAVVVTTPQQVALSTVGRELTFCAKLGIRVLGLVENMAGFACPCCDQVYDLFGGDSSTVSAWAATHRVALLARIPVDAQLGTSADGGAPLLPDGSPAQRALLALRARLMELLEAGDSQ